MKLLFTQIHITLNTADVAASDRLRFLVTLPDDWIASLEIRFQGSQLVNQETVGLLCQLIKGKVLHELCLINAPLVVGKQMLHAREHVQYQAQLDTLYLVMHPVAAGATSLEVQCVCFAIDLSSL